MIPGNSLKTPLFARFISGFLIASLALEPTPVFALRPAMDRAGLEQALSPSRSIVSQAGLEEPVKDRTSEVVGRHPFPVRVFVGPNGSQAYIEGERKEMYMPLFVLPSSGTKRRLAEDGAAFVVGQPKADILSGLIVMGPQQSIEHLPKDLLHLKLCMDDAKMIGPNMAIEAAARFLFNEQYSPLVSAVNRRLAGSENPRIKTRYAPISGVGEIESLDFWVIKEGDATLVLRGAAYLKQESGVERPIAVPLLVNVAKDATDASRELEQVHRTMQADFLWHPGYVMEPYGFGYVEVSSGSGSSRLRRRVAVQVGEFLEEEGGGYHELHWYGDTGRLVHVWWDQRMRQAPLPENESLAIWRQIALIRTLYSRVEGSELVTSGADMNAGDFIGHRDAAGQWHLVRIWSRNAAANSRREKIDPIAVMINLFTLSVYDTQTNRMIWWNEPEAAIDVARVAWREQARYQAQVSGRNVDQAVWQAETQMTELLRGALREGLPLLFKQPQQLPLWGQMNRGQREETMEVLRRAEAVLKQHLEALSGLEERAGPRRFSAGRWALAAAAGLLLATASPAVGQKTPPSSPITIRAKLTSTGFTAVEKEANDRAIEQIIETPGIREIFEDPRYEIAFFGVDDLAKEARQLAESDLARTWPPISEPYRAFQSLQAMGRTWNSVTLQIPIDLDQSGDFSSGDQVKVFIIVERSIYADPSGIPIPATIYHEMAHVEYLHNLLTTQTLERVRTVAADTPSSEAYAYQRGTQLLDRMVSDLLSNIRAQQSKEIAQGRSPDPKHQEIIDAMEPALKEQLRLEEIERVFWEAQMKQPTPLDQTPPWAGWAIAAVLGGGGLVGWGIARQRRNAADATGKKTKPVVEIQPGQVEQFRGRLLALGVDWIISDRLTDENLQTLLTAGRSTVDLERRLFGRRLIQRERSQLESVMGRLRSNRSRSGLEEQQAGPLRTSMMKDGFAMIGRAALAVDVLSDERIQAVGIARSEEEAETLLSSGINTEKLIVINGDPNQFRWVVQDMSEALEMVGVILRGVDQVVQVSEEEISKIIDISLRKAGWDPSQVDSLLERIRTAVYV